MRMINHGPWKDVENEKLREQEKVREKIIHKMKFSVFVT